MQAQFFQAKTQGDSWANVWSYFSWKFSLLCNPALPTWAASVSLNLVLFPHSLRVPCPSCSPTVHASSEKVPMWKPQVIVGLALLVFLILWVIVLQFLLLKISTWCVMCFVQYSSCLQQKSKSKYQLSHSGYKWKIWETVLCELFYVSALSDTQITDSLVGRIER